MTSATITQEMIDNSANDAVLTNYQDGVAMLMDIEDGLIVRFGVDQDQLPEDVDYTPDNIIDVDDCR